MLAALSRNVPILILDEDPERLREWQLAAPIAGTKIATYATAGDALAHLARRPVAACVTEWTLEERTSLELLRIVRSRHPALPLYVVTSTPDAARAQLRAAGLTVPVFPKSEGVGIVLDAIVGRVPDAPAGVA